MKTSSPADFLREPEPKPKADENVPTIRFDAPRLTTADIVKAAETGKGVWRSLDILHRESVEEARAKAFERKYGMTPIPEPDGFWDAEDL